jgi:hypothetical protein
MKKEEEILKILEESLYLVSGEDFEFLINLLDQTPLQYINPIPQRHTDDNKFECKESK